VYRNASRWIGLGVALVIVGFAGCDGVMMLFVPESPAPEPARTPPAETGVHFDPDRAGTVEGQVSWDGPAPVVAPYRARISPHVQRAHLPFRDWANPNVPVIDRETHGVAGAVVFLRGIDPREGRPWDHPPVQVEQREYCFHVMQGEEDRRTALVRRGDPVKFTAAADDFHVVRARGADFFTFPFPRPSRPCVRRLHHPGVVELTSAAGYFWMRAYLFVDDHPYYTHTDGEGRFTLPQVPPGRYELVCWMPSWHEARRELDAETAGINRLEFREPVTRVRPVEVRAGQTVSALFRLSAEDFGPLPEPGRW
jgi:hypothetical protein